MALKSGWDEESSTKTGSPPNVSLDSRKNSNFATVPENQRWQLYAFHCLTNKTSRPLQFFPSTIFPQPSERFSQTNVLKPNNKKGTLIWHTNCSQKTYYQLLAIIEAINLEIAENSSTFRAAFQLWSGQFWTTLYALRKKIKNWFQLYLTLMQTNKFPNASTQILDAS